MNFSRDIVRESLNRAGLALAKLYPMGISLMWKAPLVLALVVVPEFIQHVAEIQLGMFDGGAATRAAADHPIRWLFGYLKVAGVLLVFLAAARFWWTRRSGGAWYDLRTVAWKRFGLGFVTFMGIPLLPLFATGQVSETAIQAAGLALTIPLLPMLFVMIAGLFGDRETPMRDFWRRSWAWILLTVALLVIGFVPAQWLHGMNHHWAMGAALPIVWGLMIFDAIVVGLLSGITGTALYLGYAAFRDGMDGNRV